MELEFIHPTQENTCGVVVTMNPDAGLRQRIIALEEQVAKIIVVDNGSRAAGHSLLESLRSDSTRIHFNETNVGVASAMNIGIRLASAWGFAWALTLDEDSRPLPGAVEALCVAYRDHPQPRQVAILAPQVYDPRLDRWSRFLRPIRSPFYQRSRCDAARLDDITTVISSGSLFRISVWEHLGGFRDDFFMDYIDTEYCLRALTHGYRITVVCSATVEHRLGNRRQVDIGPLTFYPTFHHPDRWYYISRNRIAMIRMYAARVPHWFTYDAVASGYSLVRMLLTEDDRKEKLLGVYQGIMDGVRGVMGPRPPIHRKGRS